jgi:glutamyl endopeptidase
MTRALDGAPARSCPCVSPTAADYLVVGTDERVRVTNTTVAPFRYICSIEFNGCAGCSGTLIGPSTVLTAGHCVNGFLASHVRVIPGRNGAHEPLPATRANSLIPFPGFLPGTRTDIGIIRLQNPVGRSVGFWTARRTRTRTDPVGTSISGGLLPMTAGRLPVNVSGYPADLPADPKLGCRLPGGGACASSACGPGRDVECGTQQYRSFDRTVSESAGLLRYLNDTCGGHSGSPVWVRRHPSMGGRVLVGVHISGSATNHTNAAVRLTPAILRWIFANTA